MRLGNPVHDDAHGQKLHGQQPLLRFLRRHPGPNIQRSGIRLSHRFSARQEIRCMRSGDRLMERHGLAAHAACMFL